MVYTNSSFLIQVKYAILILIIKYLSSTHSIFSAY